MIKQTKLKNKLVKTAGIVVLVGSLFGCHASEKIDNEFSYKSLLNKRGTIELYSGGKLIKAYTNAEITYHKPKNSLAIWFKTEEGKKKYWQGDAHIDLSQ